MPDKLTDWYATRGLLKPNARKWPAGFIFDGLDSLSWRCLVERLVKVVKDNATE